MNELTKRLFKNSDDGYKDFSKKLIPDTKYKIIGVRTPILKKIAKEAVKNDTYEAFLNARHEYYEEFLLHGIILGYIKTDFKTVINLVTDFLPFIDNWAICDCTVAGLKIFKKHTDELLRYIKKWLKSDDTYSVRFGVVALLGYFLDDKFTLNVLDLCANVKSKEYYINMAIAWLFSVALVKQYESALPYLLNNKLDKFTHNKTIQKAIESFRISDERKTYLKTLRK